MKLLSCITNHSHTGIMVVCILLYIWRKLQGTCGLQKSEFICSQVLFDKTIWVFVYEKPICLWFFFRCWTDFSCCFGRFQYNEWQIAESIQESFASFQSHCYVWLLWTSCHYVCKRRPIFHREFMNKFVWLVHCQTTALFVVHIHYTHNTLYVHQKKREK